MSSVLIALGLAMSMAIARTKVRITVVLALVIASVMAWEMSATGSAIAAKPEMVPVFQFDPTWPKPLPKNWVIGSVVGVDVDHKDHVWIVHRPSSLSNDETGAMTAPPSGECCAPAPPIVEFDAAGNYVQGWGGPGEGYEWPRTSLKALSCCEHGVYVDEHDNVWTGTNARDGGQVLKFTRSGKFLMQIGRAAKSKGSNDLESLGAPAGLEVDLAANELYVADGYVNRRVIVFDATTGQYKRHWGAYGNTPDDAPFRYQPGAPLPKQFGNPVHCAKITRDGLVYVCDRTNNRIQVFKKDGTFVHEAQVAPQSRASGAVHDIGFSVDKDQQFVYVADAANKKVWILRRQDLSVLGSFGRGGHFAGQLTMPHSMAVDSKGNLYVGETLEGKRVQRFLFKGLSAQRTQ
jgi:DNA-binding beta-propeller fold protein YncE